MNFDRYDDETAAFAADLLNSLGSVSGTEYLPDAPALETFLAEHRWEAPGPVTERDAEEVRAVRERLRDVFVAPDEAAATRILNEALRDAGALPQLTDHDGRWHFHYLPNDAPVAKRVAATAAMGLAAVISEGGFERLGVCAASDCADVFVDTSRNRSRRFCDDTCSTRFHVAAHRARQKQNA